MSLNGYELNMNSNERQFLRKVIGKLQRAFSVSLELFFKSLLMRQKYLAFCK